MSLMVEVDGIGRESRGRGRLVEVRGFAKSSGKTLHGSVSRRVSAVLVLACSARPSPIHVAFTLRKIWTFRELSL
jgi:hypothetical protein